MTTMPVTCTEQGCPLATMSEPYPPFCTECGASSASKIARVTRPGCKSCGHPFDGPPPKFCPECGARAATPTPGPPAPPSRPADGERPYGDVSNLIAEHEARRASQRAPGFQPGTRGLSAAEVERLERNMRKPADRTYIDPEGEKDFRKVTSYDVPDADMVRAAGLPAESGRIAVQAPEGQHRTGQLSAKGTKLEPGYASDVRVIPYSFKTPTRSRDVVGGGRRPEEDDKPMSAEDSKFYRGMEERDDAVFNQLITEDEDESSE